MRLRYAGVCRVCAIPLPVGTSAVYFDQQRQADCLSCAEQPDEASDAARHSEPVDIGTAGASARREYRRRAATREQQIRAAHPRLGGLILALTNEPQSTQAWARGAAGEEKLATALKPITTRRARLLNDRRIPGGRANIDHIVIAPAGVFVIDARRYAGRPALRVTGGLLRPRAETLFVGRRDCTKLVTGVLKQVETVRQALERAGYDTAPVIGMLCFVGADWPLVGGSFTIEGVRVLWPSKVADHVAKAVLLDPPTIAALHAELAERFAPR